MPRRFTLPSSLPPPAASRLDKVHYCLKNINARLWRELRNGALASCYVGLHSVRFTNAEQDLDWREMNRRTISSLRRFVTARTNTERHTCLQEALHRIGQKLFLVKLALKRKAERPTKEEKYAIQRYETELNRLFSLLGTLPEDSGPRVPY